MALRQLPQPKAQFFKSNGDPLSGGKIYTYEAGTTTAKDTYTDSTGSTANANPVVLDSRGEAAIWWDGTYKVVVKDASDVTLYTLDNHGTGLDPVAVPQLSLVKNYSFETATADADTPDNWTITLYTNGTQVLDDTAGNQIHGAKSIKFTSAGSGGGYAESDLFEVQEAEALSVSVALKSSVADVRNVIEIVWYDRSESLLSTDSLYDDSTTNPTTWTDQDLSATPPSNARFAKLRLTGCHSSDSTVGSTWFDNIRAFEAVVTTDGTQTLSNKTLASPVITGTVSGSGVIPLDMLIRHNDSSAATGVTVNTDAQIVTHDCGTVVADDVIFITAHTGFTKGGTAGDSIIYVRKESGTATIVFADSTTAATLENIENHTNASARPMSGTIVARVTVGGTLVIELRGQSFGSDSTANGAGLHALVLVGT